MTGKLKTIDQLELAGKRVFIRVDFNIPLTRDGRASGDARIREALPTIWGSISVRKPSTAIAKTPSEPNPYSGTVPMGLCEQKPWAEGSEGVALAMAESKALTVVGGGDTTVLLEEKGLVGDMTHVSTGGGVGGGT